MCKHFVTALFLLEYSIGGLSDINIGLCYLKTIGDDASPS